MRRTLALFAVQTIYNQSLSYGPYMLSLSKTSGLMSDFFFAMVLLRLILPMPTWHLLLLLWQMPAKN
jgi:hypothetical protein